MSEVQTQTLRNHRVDRLLVDLQELIINGYRIVNGTVRQAGAEVLVTVERSVKQDDSVKTKESVKAEATEVKTETQEDQVKTSPIKATVKTTSKVIKK